MGKCLAGAGGHADDSVHHGCEHGSQQPIHGAFGQDKGPGQTSRLRPESGVWHGHHHRLSGHHASPSGVDSATEAESGVVVSPGWHAASGIDVYHGAGAGSGLCWLLSSGWSCPLALLPESSISALLA